MKNEFTGLWWRVGDILRMHTPWKHISWKPRKQTNLISYYTYTWHLWHCYTILNLTMKHQIRKGHRKTPPFLSQGTDVLPWKHYFQIQNTKSKRGSCDKILFLSQRLWVPVSSDTFSLSSPTWKVKELACRCCGNTHQCSAQTISISLSIFVPV